MFVRFCVKEREIRRVCVCVGVSVMAFVSVCFAVCDFVSVYIGVGPAVS